MLRIRRESFKVLKSTQNRCLEIVGNGIIGSEYIVVDTHEQTCGRGRTGNVWVHIPGNIAASIGVKLNGKIPYSFLQYIPSLALYKTLRKQYPKCENLSIKYPNDIILDNQKLAGVMVSTTTDSEKNMYAVFGIGVNISSHPNSIIGATSLPFSSEVSASSILESCVYDIDSIIQGFEESSFVEEFNKSLAWIGQKVTFFPKNQKLLETQQNGLFRGVSISGVGVVELSNRDLQEVGDEFSLEFCK